jgi:hypothetical protein
MDDVRVDQSQISNYKILENVPVIFHTGASYILGDWERVSKLYDHLGGTLMEHGDFGFYYREFQSRSVHTLFLSTACSTMQLFPNTGLHLRWQDV